MERNAIAADCLMRNPSKFTTITLLLSTRMIAKAVPASTVSHGYLKHPYHPNISLKDIYLRGFDYISGYPDTMRIVCQDLKR